MIAVGIIEGVLHVLAAGAIVPFSAGLAPEPTPVVWDLLADCESGQWDADADPIDNTADWSSRAHGLYEGGLQFHPDTWDGFRDPDMPGHAADATREQQIEVAERVQAAQGWGAWPVCSRKVGVR